jgi:hypothetical protein
VPAATPLPRGPSVLTLYSAEDLLTAPGCPICRYATEASDRYLGWFALEGHAQPATITTLCTSLGMCPRHTRRLMSQPGASVRLTAVYRYVMTAARDRLTGNARRITTCPGCEHDEAAARRALGTLLEGLVDSAVLHRCQDLGGLCLPHLDAATAAGSRRPVGWLGDTLRERIADRSVPCDWLVGADRDSDTRAVLRRQLPLSPAAARSACPACLAAAEAEKDALERLPGLANDGPGPAFSLCAGHLADAATAAHGSSTGLRMLLAWQAECRSSPPRKGSRYWLRGSRSRDAVTQCGVCRARRTAALQALTRLSVASTAQDGEPPCVRHQIILQAANPRASNVSALAAARRAGQLADELAAAFDRIARERSNHRAVPASEAWRRAAAFLDGAVFGGCPPHLP